MNETDQKKEKAKQYRDAHKEEIKEKRKAYRDSHKEQSKEYSRKYKSEHAEQNAEAVAKYRDRHHENIVCNQCGKSIVEYSKATHQRLRCKGTAHLVTATEFQ